MEPLPRLTQACAECKRMKLKCDKNNPCGSCTKRGCTAICPQGRLPPKNPKNAPNSVNVSLLHETIVTLKLRVRQLEDALETVLKQHNEQPHPLLSEKLRRVGALPPPSAQTEDRQRRPTTENNNPDEELAESVGTLALDEKGTQYFSSAGALAYFWKTVQTPEDSSRRSKMDIVLDAFSRIPHELTHLAYAFPTPLTDTVVGTAMHMPNIDMKILEDCLPSYLEAWSLFETFWEHYSWHFSVFTRTKFVNQVLSPIYRRSSGGDDPAPIAHRLALLFMVFAIGDLLDFTKPFDLRPALRYCLLARASLCLSPVIDSPSLTALQAMHLMTVFGVMSHDIIGQEHTWVLSGINVKLAITLGLQHDPTKFNLPADEVDNRQYTLVAVVIHDTMQALSLGRPTSVSFGNLNWIRPSYGQIPGTDLTAQYWTACFIRDCTQKILETVVAPKPISYNKILQLDKKINDYPPPTITEVSNLADTGVGERLGRLFLFMIREVNLLFLHRRCFAFALRDHPEDPLRSPFAPSVRACYQSATTFMTQMSAATASVPQITERIWFLWPNVLTSTLILGSIVARSPGCALASSAFLELEKASRLWESVSDISSPRMRDKLQQLKQKACTAFAQYHAANHDPHKSGPQPGGLEVMEEINALGGYVGGTVRLTSSKLTDRPIQSSRPVQATSDSADSSPPGPESCATDSPDPLSEPIQQPQSFPQRYPPPAPPSSSSSSSGRYTAPSYGLAAPTPPTDPSTNYPTPKDNSVPPPPIIPVLSQQPVSGPGPQQGMVVPNDFNDIFGYVGDTGQIPPVLSGTDILEQLGLMEEWQPTMDYLGF